MRILILGGTIFLGRAIAEEALSRGHTLALFTRGQHAPELFPEAEKLLGDRNGDISALEKALKTNSFDAVIDTSGYVPRLVRRTAALANQHSAHYTFISSVSVYDLARSGAGALISEESPLAAIADESTEVVNGETYGALKALCEAAAESAMPNRVLNVRAGLIVGRYDQSGRYAYWVDRLARGGDTLAPPADALVQCIDVRDLAAWILDSVEKQLAGAFNATGHSRPMEDFLRESAAALQSSAVFTTVSEAFLTEQSVAPYMELPLWLPTAYASMHRVSCVRAQAQGLTTRSFADTMQDAHRWFFEQNTEERARLLGRSLRPEREAELLRRWRGL